MTVRRLAIILVATAAIVAVLVIPAYAARAPQPPSGVEARALSPSEIVVTWQAAAGASGYRVLRGTTSGGPYSAVTTTSSLTFTDSGLQADTTYYYVVASVVKNRTSAYSAQVSATTAAPLDAPSNFKANAGSSGMELTWDPVPGASRYDVINVTLPDNDDVVLGSTTTTSFTHTAAVQGHWYQYRVRAVGLGATADSPVLYVEMGAPTTTSLSVSPNPSEDGQNVVLVATIEAVGQKDLLFTGDAVEFYMDGSYAGRIDLGGLWAPHQAIFQLYGVPVGRHVFYAQYRGEDFTHLGASASASVEQESVPAYSGVSFGPAQVYPYGLDSWLTSAAVADVTGDGLADALMTTGIHGPGVPDEDFKLMVLAQQPDHTLAPPRMLPTHASSSRSPMRLATGDLDGDGDTDVAMAGDSGLDIFRQEGGVLAAPTLLPTGGLAVDVRIADVDQDGHNDLVVSREDEGGIVVYPGQADGGFGTPIVVGTEGNGQIEVGDMNGDGRPDIVARITFSFSVYTQTPDGGFAAPVRHDIGAGTGGMAVGDMSGDGRADVAVTISTNDPDSRILVYQQNAAGGLDDPVAYGVYDSPEPAVLADVNNDERTDLVTAHGGWWWAGVLLQRPDGLLGREQRSRVPAPNASHYDHRGIAVGDLTGDGKPDLLLADYIHGIEVLPQT
jgi:hypothetical protein